MSIWAILPVKPLKQGKTRLAGVLSEDERYVLNTTMLGNTLSVLKRVNEIDQILVVSRDSGALSISREFGVRTIQEDNPSSLNRALTLAVKLAGASMAAAVLILPADIPLLGSIQIQNLIARLSGQRQMIIVPDRREDGTNALLLSPPDAITFEFGERSFNRHVKQAESRGLHVEVVRVPELGLDLDLPEDLELLRRSSISNPLSQ